ncbi:MAG: glycosyltransferase family 2 protein [Chroococcidiopsidaceae cyanobacterium CP_BM_ER_R8_30]|nr:glycosyltransferase family 2 protein [Chroococcidiopsidaceae cyanobacterium CP_BM_ER_R8_30]
MTATVDILIPTYHRPAGLAVTLTSLISQTCNDFHVLISDQTEDSDAVASCEVQAALRVLRAHGHPITVHKHIPRRGIAEHRQFLLEQSTAPYSLFLDDDLILESDVVERMLIAIQEEGCGFVGSAVIGLSYISDIRPDEQSIEFWDGPVQPEIVLSGSAQWDRWRLHNAANLYHVQQQLGITSNKQRKYKVAWIGGCVMYDTAKLRNVGGYSFWRQLPQEHCGEDVLVQLRMMKRYGGCGLIPSGVYHQELPTTIANRAVAADRSLSC